MNPDTRKKVPFIPLDAMYWAAGIWSAFASSKVIDTMVPVAALAGDAPPIPTSNPTDRAAVTSTASIFLGSVPNRPGADGGQIVGVMGCILRTSRTVPESLGRLGNGTGNPAAGRRG